MPELPEVEITRRGIAPHLLDRRVAGVAVREARLRWPVAPELSATLTGQRIQDVRRRGKYLLLDLERGTLILHLGMSGSLRVVPAATPPDRHDHLDLVLEGGDRLRLRDPRRFGAVLWSAAPVQEHWLLRDLGPEPLEERFTPAYLYALSRKRHAAVKAFLMDSRVVVGVGNIYASESLFRAGIHPRRSCRRISAERYALLVEAVRTVLEAAIGEGGTSLRDFVREDGRPGYFARRLQVYGREGQPCPACGGAIRRATIGQRSSFFCSRCQR